VVTKKRLDLLPDIKTLINLSQSLAMLDAIMAKNWESRYYSFNCNWGDGEMMASMRDGSGDEYFILFNSHGAIIKGFSHESPMSPYSNSTNSSWPGAIDEVPTEFESFIKEPAFSIRDVTFCFWRRYTDHKWIPGSISYPQGEDPDGSEQLLSILDGNPERYVDFASWYYETDVDLNSVVHVYNHQPLTKEVIKGLNPRRRLAGLVKDIKEIGYPNLHTPIV
jgi:hypothetical protein